ncbi:hypothetical protein CGLO_07763 [Colletotrichum gloeosporioides Cg-14]|uniref:Uncharacterized protein n=1 Tax=Colletotrichum gloeosporioides (strain Cg-14) TaxID=1237896 RepID=T0LLM8_COLGC|nr:hypothetical protein CGLO_07763 [Colletotrichum gloeosporioides Cg-14]
MRLFAGVSSKSTAQQLRAATMVMYRSVP